MSFAEILLALVILALVAGECQGPSDSESISYDLGFIKVTVQQSPSAP